MLTGTVAFFAGVLVALRLPVLPHAGWLLALPCLLALGLAPGRWPRWLRPPVLAASGFLWVALHGHLGLTGVLPVDLEGRDLAVLAEVASPVARGPRSVRFEIDVVAVEGAPDVAWGGRARVDWYGEAPLLVPGERWRLRVRLKRPRGLSNPGGSDYEAWLFARGLGATGYVRGGERLAGPGGRPVARLRHAVAAGIERALGGHPQAGVVAGLVVGLTDGVTRQQWEVFRRTGTTHLMAISGSHVALVGGLAFVALRRGWAALGRPALWVAAPRVAALGALGAAAAYAALAGLSVPTQRAVIMMGVALLAYLLRAVTSPTHTLALGLLGVLLVDPMAPLAPGFWLSFAAVAVLLTGIRRPAGAAEGLWRRWARPQLAVAVGLLPLTLVFFGESPWLGPLANLVAVPWVGALAVPLALLGALLLSVLPAAAEGLLRLAAGALDLLWWLLGWLASTGGVYVSAGRPAVLAVASASVGVALLLAPRGVPGRWVGWLWLAPLLFPAVARPLPGEVWVTVLDVGQGLSAVVETAGRVLVYDAGPPYGPGRDAGESVVVPFLRSRGWGAVDVLVLSHNDVDHVGGAASVLGLLPAHRVIGHAPAAAPEAEPCEQGQGWLWDGVALTVLHPGAEPAGGDNARSCVLRVSGPGGAVLLPGDVEGVGERALIEREGKALGADVLVVPHHGSRGSSSQAFVAAVRPRHALFATGYRNRFGFPAPEVLERYQVAGAAVHDTARAGAIRVVLAPGRAPVVTHHRTETRRFWHATPGE